MDGHSAPVQMVQLLGGFQVSQALYVAAKIGVADRLTSGPLTLERLASELDADPLALLATPPDPVVARRLQRDRARYVRADPARRHARERP